MAKFTDEIIIRVKGGKGGDGCVSFRREKYIPKGGPDGGDGGKGGNVFLIAKDNIISFSHLDHNKLYKAKNGFPGMGRKKYGKSGEDIYIRVPIGTIVYDSETGEKLGELLEKDTILLVAKGGKGGRGNVHFKSPTNQTPRYAEPGEEGEYRKLKLELKLIADVGLTGLPNAGKSTLLKALTNAKPKIAEFPFTTLIPNIGVIKTEEGDIIKLADIPGIIEGAHKGIGLGLSFLKHIEKVKILIFVLDITQDIKWQHNILQEEIGHYNKTILKRDRIIFINKVDLIKCEENIIKDFPKDYTICGSALKKINIQILKEKIIKLYKENLQ